MKKILSTLLALVLVLSLATVAFADEVETSNEWNGNYEPVAAGTTFDQIKKTYNVEGSVNVSETLSFTSTPVKTNPDYVTDANDQAASTVANLTVADLVVTDSKNPGMIQVTLPALTKAGKYEWIIKENEGVTPGVTYSKDEVHVIVLVEYDNENHVLKIANANSYILGTEQSGEDGKTEIVKKDTFANTFKSGSFTVAKDVIGNMANEKDEFEISVTLTSEHQLGTNFSLAGTTVTPSQWTPNYKEGTTAVENYTYTSTLDYSKSDGAKTFSDIPVGVKVTVVENEAAEKMNGYTKKGIYSGGYTVSGTTVTGDEFTSLTVEDATNAKITVVNENSTSIITGVALDSMPYFVILSVACVGMFLLLTKKRATREF